MTSGPQKTPGTNPVLIEVLGRQGQVGNLGRNGDQEIGGAKTTRWYREGDASTIRLRGSPSASPDDDPGPLPLLRQLRSRVAPRGPHVHPTLGVALRPGTSGRLKSSVCRAASECGLTGARCLCPLDGLASPGDLTRRSRRPRSKSPSRRPSTGEPGATSARWRPPCAGKSDDFDSSSPGSGRS